MSDYVKTQLYRDPVDITTALRGYASQEGGDSEEHDLMIKAADVIERLRNYVKDKITLEDDAFDEFIESCDNAEEPNQALMDAARLEERDAKRDLGSELLTSVSQMKATDDFMEERASQEQPARESLGSSLDDFLSEEGLLESSREVAIKTLQGKLAELPPERRASIMARAAEILESTDRAAMLAAMPDEDIDTSDIPELDDAFWKNAKVRYPAEGKERLTVRFDEDMVQWFRSQGRGYQTKMNAVLRSFYEAHREER